MAVAAPGFGLAVVGLGPAVVRWWGYLLLWVASSGLVAGLVYNKLSRTGLGYASRYGSGYASKIGLGFASRYGSGYASR